MELSIQLFIIMVGQQALNTVVEMIIPYVKYYLFFYQKPITQIVYIVVWV